MIIRKCHMSISYKTKVENQLFYTDSSSITFPMFLFTKHGLTAKNFLLLTGMFLLGHHLMIPALG